MPFYSQSVVSQGANPNSLLFHCFHFRFTFEFIKDLGSTSLVIFVLVINVKFWCNVMVGDYTQKLQGPTLKGIVHNIYIIFNYGL
jgi:hypothetical protein